MLDITVLGTSTSQGRLLVVDDTVHILADPGWNGHDDLSFYTPIIHNIDMIILSQTSTQYLGAFVKLLHEFPHLRSIPTYSTLPVSRFGRIAVCELYRSIGILGPVVGNLIELGDIVKYFNSIKPLNYSQTIHLSSINKKLINLSLTAYNSGYSIGGSIWLIENNINERIVYAPVWNHSKDEFLNNCKLFNNSDLMRPTTFITNCEFTNSKFTHSIRIEKFLDLIQQNLRNGSNVLLPTSLSARFFELILPVLLHRNIHAKIYLINYTGLENLKTLGNFIEWINSNLSKIWENETQSNLILENNRINIIKYSEINSLDKSLPHIFFMDDQEFNVGSILSQFVIDMNKKLNLSIILTEIPNNDSIMNKFYSKWKSSVDNEADLCTIDLPKLKLVSVTEKLLRGKELAKYEKFIIERREEAVKAEYEEIERQKREDLLESELKNDNDDDDDDDETDDDDNEINQNKEKIILKDDKLKSIDLPTMIKEAEIKYQESKSLVDILSLPRDFDVSTLKHKHRMFPMVNSKLNSDDYGIVIDHEDYKIYDDDRFPIISDKDEIIENDDNEKLKKKRKIESATIAHSLDAMIEPVSRTKKNTTITIKCGFSFVDLSGNHDLRSLKFSTQQLKPRKVIILPQIKGGDQQSLMINLDSESKNQILSRTIHKSSLQIEFIKCLINEPIKLGNVITSYEITLDEPLVKNLNWKLLNDEYSVSYVTGFVEKIKDWDYKLNLESSATSNNKLTTNALTKIGDIKLTQLRSLLKNKQHRVELLGDGRLVVDDEIVIVKADEGNLQINGTLSPLFYNVKRLVESMLATI